MEAKNLMKNAFLLLYLIMDMCRMLSHHMFSLFLTYCNCWNIHWPLQK